MWTLVNPSKSRAFFIQFILYSFVGAIACVVDLSVFFLLIQLEGISLILATSISFAVATLANFTLCYKFIFSMSTKHLFDQILRTGCIAFIGLIFNSALFGLLIHYTRLPIFFAKIIVVPVVMIWNFGARRMFVYSPEIHPSTRAVLEKLWNRTCIGKKTEKIQKIVDLEKRDNVDSPLWIGLSFFR